MHGPRLPLTRAVAEGVRPAVPLSVFGTVLFWAPISIRPPLLASYVQHLAGSLPKIGCVLGASGLTHLLFRLPVSHAPPAGGWPGRAGRVGLTSR